MPMLSLGQAARLTGLGKTTITRAIKAGKLSANRRQDGTYEIDPAELSRVYEVHPETPATVSLPGDVVHHATPAEVTRDPDVTARLAALEAEVTGLKDLLAEVRQSRDDWREQATRLALPRPSETSPGTTPATRRPWWRWLGG